jgi:septal ring factor EnvC (AmiA/AmiB activator)
MNDNSAGKVKAVKVEAVKVEAQTESTQTDVMKTIKAVKMNAMSLILLCAVLFSAAAIYKQDQQIRAQNLKLSQFMGDSEKKFRELAATAWYTDERVNGIGDKITEMQQNTDERLNGIGDKITEMQQKEQKEKKNFLTKVAAIFY